MTKAAATAAAAAVAPPPAKPAAKGSDLKRTAPSDYPEALKKKVLKLGAPPPKPVAPLATEVDMGDAGGKVKDYFARLGPYARHVLEKFLQKGGVLKSAFQPLADMEPAPISEKEDSLQAFREPWNLKNCLISLRRSGVYEGNGSIWWISDSADALASDKGGSYLAAVGAEPSYGQFLSAMYFWSKEAFNASAADDAKRMYIFPGLLPTSVPDLVGIEKQLAVAGKDAPPAPPRFSDLPLFAGRALVRSYQAAIIEAVEADDKTLVRKLLEAGLSVTIRMRLSDDRNDRILDALAAAESIRLLKRAIVGGDSFMDFTAAVCELDAAKRTMQKENTVKQIKQALDLLGITYGGKPLSDMAIKAIRTIAPFAAVGAVREAFRNLQSVCHTLTDQSKLMRICQAVQARNPVPQESHESMVAVLTNVKVSLWTGDVRESEACVTMLVGAKKQVFFCFFASLRLGLEEISHVT